MENKHLFTVNGLPFFPLGGQVHNSSGYSVQTLEKAFDALNAINANTVEIPVYWDQIEPTEGQYELAHVGEIIAACKQRGLKIVFLWFATWKNASMRYAPAWVKQNKARFWRVTDPDGVQYPVLSPACEETLAADSRALNTLLAYVRENDPARTVILLQIENEPGILHGPKRDHGEAAERLFGEPVPAGLLEALKAAEGCPAHRAWEAQGALENRPWAETFGCEADELFNAWQTAAYINTIAERAGPVHNIPFYANFWLDRITLQIAGASYPSGGAVEKTFEVWQWAAPRLAFLAPDIYWQCHEDFSYYCKVFSSGGNPLFIPESGQSEGYAANLFTAVAEYGAIGYHVFGVEDLVWDDGTLRPEALPLAGSFKALATALPLVSRHLGTGRIRAVNQREFMWTRFEEFDEAVAFIQYTDTRRKGKTPEADEQAAPRGCGMIIEAGPSLFYVLGQGFNVVFMPKRVYNSLNSGAAARGLLEARTAAYLSVAEGHFDEQGAFVPKRWRNGDEVDYGIWVNADTGVVQVELEG